MSEETENEVSAEVIKEAKGMGWTPLEQFKGNPEKWVDADAFVERGQHILPILQANNRKMRADLLTRDAKIGTLESELTSTKTAIEKLEGHWSEANKRLVKEAKEGLIRDLKQAREDNDTEAEQRLLGELDEVRDREREAAKKPEKKEPDKKDEPYTENISPEFKEWEAENTWYGEDKKKTRRFLDLAKDLREEGNTFTGRAFMEAVEASYEETYGEEEPTPRASSKVETGDNSHGNRNKGGKSFASLPPEAKKACAEDNDKLVGPDKQFKKVEEWQAYYAKIYYGDES